MNDHAKAIVRRVLSEAANAPHFFDLSDAQRLNWMIEHAYTLGQQEPLLARTDASRRKRRRVKRRASPRAVLSIVVKSH